MAKQPCKTCSSCPFTDKSEPGALGGATVETLVGQTFMPFWVPCHQHIDYDDPNWKENIQKERSIPQCVGHAITRHHVGAADRMPDELLRVDPYDGDRVFTTIAHFWSYHTEISVLKAANILRGDTLRSIIEHEVNRTGARISKPKSNEGDK